MILAFRRAGWYNLMKAEDGAMNDRWKLVVRDGTPYDAAKLKKTLLIVGADVLCVALGIFFFIFFRYGIVRAEPGVGIASPRSGSAYFISGESKSTDNGGDLGYFSFDGRFLHSTPETRIDGDTTYYYDASCELTITTYALSTGPVYVADVFVSDLSRLQTALANDTYGKGQRARAQSIAAQNDALFAITGDNYSERYGGVIMRNGILYSKTADRDVCVLNWDGTVDLYAPAAFNLTHVMDKHPVQIWSFGPILLADGSIPSEYDTDMLLPGRRAAFGYYEPGHYCFVIMEGYVTLESLSETMRALGCESAYALYGGTLAEMDFDGAEISLHQEAKRECSDMILIPR